MIKVHKNYIGESYFKGETMYDSKRDKEFSISIFGVTVFRKTEKFNLDLINIDSKTVGFKSR